MIQVDSIPDCGQFVAVWEYNNEIWSETYINDYGDFTAYDEGKDDFFDCEHNVQMTLLSHHSVMFFMVGEK